MAKNEARVLLLLVLSVVPVLSEDCSGSHDARTPDSGMGGGDQVTGAGGETEPRVDGSSPDANGFGGHPNGIPTCTAVDTSPAPSAGLIADFNSDGDAGIEIMGTIRNAGLGSATSVTTTTGGHLHIVENAVAPSADQDAATYLAFDRCIDATGFAGVQFSISGTAAPCTLLYSTLDSEHTLGAGGPPDATNLTVSLAPTQFGPMVRIPFVGPGAPTNGIPNAPLDRAKVLGIAWVLLIRQSLNTPGCTADLTIDNVAFYR